MKAPKSVLPASVRALDVYEQLKRLEQLDAEKHHAFEILVLDVLEHTWRAEFYTGPRGGLKVRAK